MNLFHLKVNFISYLNKRCLNRLPQGIFLKERQPLSSMDRSLRSWLVISSWQVLDGF